MVVFDIVVNGETKGTIRPENQNFYDMYWYMVDQMERLVAVYGPNVKLVKRTMSVNC